MDPRGQQHIGQPVEPSPGHGDRQRVVQDRLYVDGVQRIRAVRLLHRFRDQPVLVHREGHEGDAEPGGDGLQHRVGELLDTQPGAGPGQCGDGGGDGLAAVAGEQDPFRIGPPATPRENFGGGVAGGGRAVRPDRAERRLQVVGAHQLLQAGGEQPGLFGHDGVVELQVDPAVGGLGQGGCGGGRTGRVRDEGAAPDLADGETAAGELLVDADGGGVGDGVPPGELPLWRQAFPGPEPAGRDLRRHEVGDGPEVLHGLPSPGAWNGIEAQHCTECNVPY
ncbi:hypothetical protein SFIMM107S_04437 [Streptomyces griseus]